MSLNYRENRINKIVKYWSMKKETDLIAYYKIQNSQFEKLKRSIKLYVCAAMNINYSDDDKKFLVNVDNSRLNLLNITPNGGVVPKKEFQLEYNLFLREWCNLMRNITRKKPNLISNFRVTPNIRIKFGKEIDANKNRELNTSYPHSDAWLDGPWGMNCFLPIAGDTQNNNLLYYDPIKFEEKFLSRAKTYKEMQWVLSYYKALTKFKPKPGNIYISDYGVIHQTYRKKNAKTRISLDTTLIVGNHKPYMFRKNEYKSKIPNYGIDEFVKSNKFENDKVKDKKNFFSHYTKALTENIKL